MPKVNPSTIRRTQRATFERKLVDPINPDIEVVLTLRKLGRMETVAAMERANDLLAKHMTGYGEIGEPGYKAPEYLPFVDGQAVTFGLGAARCAETVAQAQMALEEDRYSSKEILCLMASNAYCNAIEAIADEVSYTEEREDDPLASSGSGETSSGTPDTATSPRIPM